MPYGKHPYWETYAERQRAERMDEDKQSERSERKETIRAWRNF